MKKLSDIFYECVQQGYLVSKIVYNSLAASFYQAKAGFFIWKAKGHKKNMVDISMKALCLCQEASLAKNSDLDNFDLMKAIDFHYKELKKNGLLQREGYASQLREKVIYSLGVISNNLEKFESTTESDKNIINDICKEIRQAEKQHKTWKNNPKNRKDNYGIR